MRQKELLYLKAKYYYYIVGESIMLDSEFDKLEAELKSKGSKVVEYVDFPFYLYIVKYFYLSYNIIKKQLY